MATGQTTALTPAQAALAFLKYAKTYDDIVQVGTINSGVSGGATASVNWNREVQTAPSWARAIVVHVSLPISVTLPASSTATISEFLPWAGLSHNLVLGGAPPFAAPVSGVPFWLDDITNKERYDPSDTGPTEVPASWRYTGASTDSYTIGSLVPGGTVVNSGASPVTNNYTLQFTYRIRLARSDDNRTNPNMFGYLPLGDPMNRPRLDMYLNPIVGPNPEFNLIQDIANAGITATLSSAGSVTLVWESKALDILPSGISLPSPLVQMGLTVNTSPTSIQNSGQIVNVPHRAAMIYEKVFHLLTSGQQNIDADYFGLWLTGEQQSARWEYDANLGNFWKYYNDVHRRYRRYLPKGVFVADLVGGETPETPYNSPYNGLMSPDVTYAAVAGVPATPAMQTSIRIPSGVTPSVAYCRTYSFGLVSVPY
jgi:hypothetical protein